MHSILFQLGLTVSLALVPFISASSSASQPVVHRDLQLPLGWTEFGCWTDDPGSPTLTSFMYIDQRGLTIEDCVATCIGAKASIAGLEQGTDCYCGDSLTDGSTLASFSDCSTACSGNPAENCGGPNRLHIFWNGIGSTPPTIVQSVNEWEFMGCYTDTNNRRTLTSQADVYQFNNSVEICTSACYAEGYSLAGLESAYQCWCDNTIQNGGTTVDSSLSVLACPGKSTEICGGPDVLTVYRYIGS